MPLVNVFLYIFLFAFSFPCTFLYGTAKEISFDLPSLHEDLQSLSTFCLKALEERWLFSRPLSNTDIKWMENSIFNNDFKSHNSKNITISTPALFKELWDQKIAFLPPPFPRVLLIFVDNMQEPLTEEDLNYFIKNLNMPLEFELSTPLWDFEEYRLLEPRELSGLLSNDYFQLMKKYNAKFLAIVQRDDLYSSWDFRLLKEGGKELLHHNCSAESELRTLLVQEILKAYSLNENLERNIFTLSRMNLISNYEQLIHSAEISSLSLRSIDQEKIRYEIFTHWNDSLLEIIYQKFSENN
jgi:hypothetical protein